MTIVTNQKELI